MSQRPPTKLLDEASLHRRERRFLESALDASPPTGAQSQVWAALQAQLPPPPGGGAGPDPGAAPAPGTPAAGGAATTGAAASAPVAAASTAALVKAGLVGAALMASLLTGSAWLTAAPDAPSPVVPVVTSASPPSGRHPDDPAPLARPADPAPLLPAGPASPVASAPSLAAPLPPSGAPPPRVLAAAEPANELPAPAVALPGPAPGASDPTPAPPATSTERATRLLEEAQMVQQARNDLRTGNAAGALARLEQASSRFAGGVLRQEREALTIQALAGSGQRAAASQRAASFLREFPSSPYVAEIAPLAPR